MCGKGNLTQGLDHIIGINTNGDNCNCKGYKCRNKKYIEHKWGKLIVFGGICSCESYTDKLITDINRLTVDIVILLEYSAEVGFVIIFVIKDSFFNNFIVNKFTFSSIYCIAISNDDFSVGIDEKYLTTDIAWNSFHNILQSNTFIKKIILLDRIL